MATINKNAKAIHGEVKDFGTAPYKDIPENKNSFYVTLEQNGKENKFWGNGLKTAVEDAEIKKGDLATFVDRGTQTVNVPDKNGDFIPAKKRFWDAEKYEKPLQLQNEIERVNTQDKKLDFKEPVDKTAESLINGKTVSVDPDTNKDVKDLGLPQSVDSQYIAIAKNRYLRDAKVNFYDKENPKTVAFEDRMTSLATSKNDDKTVKSMLDMAQSKGWKAVNIKGDAEFKKKMWIEANIRGIETKGYKPTEQDKAELLIAQEGKTKNSLTNDATRTKEIEREAREREKQAELIKHQQREKEKREREKLKDKLKTYGKLLGAGAGVVLASVAIAHINNDMDKKQFKAIPDNDNTVDKYSELHFDLEQARADSVNPEVKIDAINQMTNNMAQDTRQLLEQYDVEPEKIDRIVSNIESDVTNRIEHDLENATVMPPMADYVQANNSHIIKEIEDKELAREIMNKNNQIMIDKDELNVERMTADKNSRYAEIVSQILHEKKVDDLTVSKSHEILDKQFEDKSIEDEKTVSQCQQMIGAELYKSGYTKESIEIMKEVNDRYYEIDADIEIAPQEQVDKTADKDFKEVTVIEDVKIGEAYQETVIASENVEDKAVTIEAVKLMVHDLYKDNPDKLKACLNAIDDKSPDIMNGSVDAPAVELRETPHVEFNAPNQSSDMDRGR